MSDLNNHLIAAVRPECHNKIEGEGYRISVLTPSLIRVERGKKECFTDSATQKIWFRDFTDVTYKTEEDGRFLLIKTEAVIFYFNKAAGRVVYIQFKDNEKKVKCTNFYNLKGTARTLDQTAGAIRLKSGVISRNGVAILDDSESLLLDTDGIVKPRKSIIHYSDIYIFAYGNDYIGCMKDFYRLSGQIPLIPRYALSNWWSRYRAYTQDEYIALMQRFITEDIPITVATVDMDWHWVDIKKQFNAEFKGRYFNMQSSGWTGYSWNTDLFPDYKDFLKWLKDKNFHVTLNLHPADGVRWFENMYPEMAKAMDIDPESKETVKFDVTDPKFINAYFDILHHPYEKEGVDFWWIDWQQGKKSSLKGLDPLWSLNHYHFLDNGREKRPLILSRYAGPGSHRYPLGFSGDTVMSWRVLNFQPYFTVNASNVGYTWWSHDIGGHMFGKKSDELYLRWVQFGVFSPVMRLHSTSNDLTGKEPWNFRRDVEEYTKEQLRLRHRLLPYIYTMNYRSYSQGRALMEPMYYLNPNDQEAYAVPNQYYFGTELIVNPITRRLNRKTFTASADMWLPKGRWTDIFTGTVYEGGGWIRACRGLESIPVLAKEGAIIPLSENKGNDWRNPTELTVWAFRGNSDFTLYEDEGEDKGYQSGIFIKTPMSIKEEESGITFCVNPGAGDQTVVPAERKYNIEFKDITRAGKVEVKLNGKKYPFILSEQSNITVCVDKVKSSDMLEITIKEYQVLTNPSLRQAATRIMSMCQGSVIRKSINYSFLMKRTDDEKFLLRLDNLAISDAVKDAICDLAGLKRRF